MLMAILIPVLLFIFSFLYAFPIKRVAAGLQSFFVKTPDQVVAVQPIVNISQKELKGSDLRNKAELEGVFATFDKNKDGYITRKELWDSLKNIGMLLGEDDVADIVSRADSNGDGLIDFDEFSEVFGSIMVNQGEVSGDGEADLDLRDAFDVFDGDRDGLITVEELGLALSSLGFKEGKRLEDCKEMIRRIDMDGDGMVNFDEFKRMMNGGGCLVPVS